jgi:hypothetical protein
LPDCLSHLWGDANGVPGVGRASIDVPEIDVLTNPRFEKHTVSSELEAVTQVNVPGLRSFPLDGCQHVGVMLRLHDVHFPVQPEFIRPKIPFSHLSSAARVTAMLESAFGEFD